MPDIELSMVAYYDVVDAIGIDTYIQFLHEINAVQNGIVGGRPEQMRCMAAQGFKTGYGISYSAPEDDLEDLKTVTVDRDDFFYMRTKRRVETVNRKYPTWKQRVDLVRSYGYSNPIIAVADVRTKEDLEERRDAGISRVIVGNVLMNLWGNEHKLWELLSEFQSTERSQKCLSE